MVTRRHDHVHWHLTVLSPTHHCQWHRVINIATSSESSHSHGISPPTMSLSTLTQYWPTRHMQKSVSNLDVGVAILATSFVS